MTWSLFICLSSLRKHQWRFAFDTCVNLFCILFFAHTNRKLHWRDRSLCKDVYKHPLSFNYSRRSTGRNKNEWEISLFISVWNEIDNRGRTDVWTVINVKELNHDDRHLTRKKFIRQAFKAMVDRYPNVYLEDNRWLELVSVRSNSSVNWCRFVHWTFGIGTATKPREPFLFYIFLFDFRFWKYILFYSMLCRNRSLGRCCKRIEIELFWLKIGLIKWNLLLIVGDECRISAVERGWNSSTRLTTTQTNKSKTTEKNQNG